MYQQAVNMGQDIEAMNCLGLMYEQGLNLDQNDKSHQSCLQIARNLYAQALKIDPKFTDAMFNLGILLYRFSTVTNLLDDNQPLNSSAQNKQQDQGVDLLHQASEMGHIRSKQFLIESGLLYTN